MGVELFKFSHEGKNYSVEKSFHTYDNRDKSKYHRDSFMNKERYKEVILRAMRRGLTQFRGKESVISFYDYQNKPHSLLVSLSDDNLIFIISVYVGWRDQSWYTNFIKVGNRINITDYVLPYMPTEKRKENTKEKLVFQIEQECRKEDDVFLNAMKRTK